MAYIFYPMRIVVTFLFIMIFFTVNSQHNMGNQKLIQAPEDPQLWDAWRDSLRLERDRIKNEINYNDRLYKDPAFSWAADCFNIYFLMLFDNSFYNPQTHLFDVDQFVLNTEKEFGKIDGIVLWHAYPRIGVDPRNQFDHYRDFPGGLKALKKVVNIFHELGIRVFIDYNPWDKGTRQEARDDIDVLTEIVQKIDADGIFLDTLSEGTKSFRSNLDAVKSGVVLESELALPVERIRDHHMSWAQWFEDSHVPGILWNKWFEQRHMMHQIKRWNQDHTSELHTAWMNGSGMLVWENVFGTWVPWNERDKSYLRIMGPVQRKFDFLFQGEGWFPLYPVLMGDVYSSLWFDDRYRLWTVVNRSDEWKRGILIKLPRQHHIRVYDLFQGLETEYPDLDTLEIRIEIPPRGLGAILVISSSDTDGDILEFLNDQKRMYARLNIQTEITKPIDSLIQRNKKNLELNRIAESMAIINKFPDQLQVSYIQRECGFYDHVHYIQPPGRIHQVIEFNKNPGLSTYAIDLIPVTNRQYYDFMMSAGYKPVDTINFLKHWLNGIPAEDLLDHPVVYVSLDDARAYAEWAGKRLPSDDEWQCASQGSLGFKYPWGDQFEPDNCNHGQYGGTTPVKRFPQGRSPYGCYDMCGNTWEWTESERTDGHTRYIILKGGSWFKADGSDWYVQGGPQPTDRSTKYILFWPGLDRSSTIGFRCAVDVID